MKYFLPLRKISHFWTTVVIVDETNPNSVVIGVPVCNFSARYVCYCLFLVSKVVQYLAVFEQIAENNV